MKENKTTEFSFILKPAEYGVGVFVTHNIKNGTYLRLFGNENLTEGASILRKRKTYLKYFMVIAWTEAKQCTAPEISAVWSWAGI